MAAVWGDVEGNLTDDIERGLVRLSRHRGLPTEPPARAPPRDEPYWQSVVLWRKAMAGQLEMFAA